MNNEELDIPTPKKTTLSKIDHPLSPEEYQDKILGAIVGSAIGDAMGASTEMWDRHDIQKQHGYITGLTDAIREKSAEGIWQHNMVAGSTTDDTRWKYFIGQYLRMQETKRSGKDFAHFIVDYYQSLLGGLNKEGVRESTDVLDEEMEKVNWIKEWARVALAYEKGPSEYAAAQNRFYGGEMSCAGMLYTPMFGLTSRSSEEAYQTGFEHSIFDIGYARDISSLVSVMTFTAMHTADIDSIIPESLLIDPHKFTDSRLIGRLASNLALEAQFIVDEEILLPILEEGETLPAPPSSYPRSPEDWYKENVIFDRLAAKQKAIAFHAGEIWQILIAGLTFGDGDFDRTMQFVVNYGRDNDTVAAVAGMILGANIGYEKLPTELKSEVMKVSKEIIGINLEELATTTYLSLEH